MGRSVWVWGLALASLVGGCGDDSAAGVGSEVQCQNSTDDDGDGQTDCSDSDCAENVACVGVSTPEDCANGDDDDGDGDVDCDDDDCADQVGCVVPIERCASGLDEDGDGSVDCEDDECMVGCLAGCDAPIVLTLPALVAGTTVGRADSAVGSCQTGGAPDVVYEVSAPSAGILDVVLAGPPHLGMYVRTECGDASSEVACGFETHRAVAAGETLFIVVDGLFAAAEGTYVLEVGLHAVTCGDEIVDAPEACDPPDPVGCADDCRFRPESRCSDLVDQDEDDLFDCLDPDCSAQCASGVTPTGGACDEAGDCRANDDDPFCFSEAEHGWPGGACSEWCDPTANDCNGDALCSELIPGHGLCFDQCNVNADCRAGYVCFGTCFPVCTEDAQCPLTMHCSPAGACMFQEICTGGIDEDRSGFADCFDPACEMDDACPEDCANDLDDDGDGFVDCRDSRCLSDAACPEDCEDALDNDSDGAIDCQDATCASAPICADPCSVPLEVSVPMTVTGTTMGGPDLFTGSCQSGGSPERIVHVTAAQTGVLHLVLTSEADLGLYVLGPAATSCTEGALIACMDSRFGAGGTDVLDVPVTAGDELFVFVDGTFFSAGAFALELAYGEPEVCDDNQDNDLDGARDCDDVDCDLDAACPVVGLCAAPLALALGTNSGTTSGASSAFSGSCTGGGNAREQIYAFTSSTAAGELLLTLSSATDQGLYARATCEDRASELACHDIFAGGTDEELEVFVRGPVTVFVDGYTNGSHGPYTLTAAYTDRTANQEIEPNQPLAQANAFVPPYYLGALQPSGDEDWVAVPLLAGQTLIAETRRIDGVGCGLFDSVLVAYAADGTLLVIDDDSGLDFCSYLSYTASGAGTVYVQVTAFGGFAEFEYRLLISVSDPAP
jgi:hypothetical protein